MFSLITIGVNHMSKRTGKAYYSIEAFSNNIFDSIIQFQPISFANYYQKKNLENLKIIFFCLLQLSNADSFLLFHLVSNADFNILSDPSVETTSNPSSRSIIESILITFFKLDLVMKWFNSYPVPQATSKIRLHPFFRNKLSKNSL